VLSPIDEVGVGSVGDIGVELYGCLSLRVGAISSVLSALPLVPSATEGEAIDDVVAPVLQVMPDLQELCASPSLPLSVERVKVDSSMILCSPEGSDVTSTSIPPSPALNPDALFAKELCDVLSSLEDAVPGCGRAIACLLIGSTIKSKSKKVGDCHRTGPAPEKRSHSGAKARRVKPLEGARGCLMGNLRFLGLFSRFGFFFGCGVALCLLLRCFFKGSVVL
jgi:hypothetical protein